MLGLHNLGLLEVPQVQKEVNLVYSHAVVSGNMLSTDRILQKHLNEDQRKTDNTSKTVLVVRDRLRASLHLSSLLFNLFFSGLSIFLLSFFSQALGRRQITPTMTLSRNGKQRL